MTLPSQRPSKGFIQDNPEKFQLVLFPAITLALFATAIVLLWIVNSVIPAVTLWVTHALASLH